MCENPHHDPSVLTISNNETFTKFSRGQALTRHSCIITSTKYPGRSYSQFLNCDKAGVEEFFLDVQQYDMLIHTFSAVSFCRICRKGRFSYWHWKSSRTWIYCTSHLGRNSFYCYTERMHELSARNSNYPCTQVIETLLTSRNMTGDGIGQMLN